MNETELGTAEAIDVQLNTQPTPSDDEVTAAVAKLEGDADGDI